MITILVTTIQRDYSDQMTSDKQEVLLLKDRAAEQLHFLSRSLASKGATLQAQI